MKAIREFKIQSAPQILLNGIKIVREEVENLKIEVLSDSKNDTSIFTRIKKSNNLII
jgi:hypothetical protein